MEEVAVEVDQHSPRMVGKQAINLKILDIKVDQGSPLVASHPSSFAISNTTTSFKGS